MKGDGEAVGGRKAEEEPIVELSAPTTARNALRWARSRLKIYGACPERPVRDVPPTRCERPLPVRSITLRFSFITKDDPHGTRNAAGARRAPLRTAPSTGSNCSPGPSPAGHGREPGRPARRVPQLQVAHPAADGETGDVYASCCRNGNWWFWWPWAERIAEEGDLDAAAAIIERPCGPLTAQRAALQRDVCVLAGQGRTAGRRGPARGLAAGAGGPRCAQPPGPAASAAARPGRRRGLRSAARGGRARGGWPGWCPGQRGPGLERAPPAPGRRGPYRAAGGPQCGGLQGPRPEHAQPGPAERDQAEVGGGDPVLQERRQHDGGRPVRTGNGSW